MAAPDSDGGLNGNGERSGSAGQHTRTYQACIPCRKRKVRCDLGPVDNPHEPPCVRCRREAKECFFSATRRKRRAADSGADPEEVEPDDYEVRGGRKRLKEDSVPATNDISQWDARPAYSPSVYLPQPLTPGGSVGRLQPLRRPPGSGHEAGATGGSPLRDEERDEQVNNQTTAMLQTAELHSGHDSLNVLIQAAGLHRTEGYSDHRPAKPFPTYPSATTSPATAPYTTPDQQTTMLPPKDVPEAAIDPAISDESEMAAALATWSRFRFVRNGWFSAHEGMHYIEYFYTYLSPLTPIAVSNYRPPRRHLALLEDEPLLAITILMITSRYTTVSLPGCAGSIGRSYALHQRLWTYIQRMIDRLVWGRDQPGRAMAATNNENQAGCDVNPLSRKGLLTLGTVESLMLLTEWHSRLVHFPDDEDDAELMAPRASPSDQASDASLDIGGKPTRAWVEPCYRSDRMCWMLLQVAMSVAMEIGVFDKNSSRHTKTMSEALARSYEQRKSHVRNMLLVYVTQTSGRLGITAMLPDGFVEPTKSELYRPEPGVIQDSRDMVLHFWIRLVDLVKKGNERFYANREHTRELIRSGGYRKELDRIMPDIIKWRHDLDNYHDVTEEMRNILLIEYEHCIVCLTGLVLQATIERCIYHTGKRGAAGAISPSELNEWYGAEDRRYVATLINSCRNVLNIVVDGLAPPGFLKHAPVRTSFRIISVTMILIKTFTLGMSEKDMGASLNLLSRTVDVLKESAVDDVHLAVGFAEFVSILVHATNKSLRRLGDQGISRAVSQSPAPSSMYTAPSMNPVGKRTSTGYQKWSARGASTNEHGTPAYTNNGPVVQPYNFSDSGDQAITLMPPPTVPASPNMTHTSISANYGASYEFGNNGFGLGNGYDNPDWYALPLDPILQTNGQDVTQTGFGPAVGQHDILDFLLNGNQSF